MSLNDRERQVMMGLEEHDDAMIELLGEVVNTDSNSYDHAGVDAVITRFRRHLEERGFAPQLVETAPVGGVGFGNCLKATTPAKDERSAKPASCAPAKILSLCDRPMSRVRLVFRDP